MAVDKISAGPTTQRDVDESIYMLDELSKQASRLADRILSHATGSDSGLAPDRDEPPTLGMFPSMNRRLRRVAETMEQTIKTLEQTSSLLSLQSDEPAAGMEVPGPSRRR